MCRPELWLLQPPLACQERRTSRLRRYPSAPTGPNLCGPFSRPHLMSSALPHVVDTPLDIARWRRRCSPRLAPSAHPALVDPDSPLPFRVVMGLWCDHHLLPTEPSTCTIKGQVAPPVWLWLSESGCLVSSTLYLAAPIHFRRRATGQTQIRLGLVLQTSPPSISGVTIDGWLAPQMASPCVLHSMAEHHPP